MSDDAPQRQIDPEWERGTVIERGEHGGVVELDGWHYGFANHECFRNGTYRENTQLGATVYINKRRRGISAHPIYEPLTMEQMVSAGAKKLADAIDADIAAKVYAEVYEKES